MCVFFPLVSLQTTWDRWSARSAMWSPFGTTRKAWKVIKNAQCGSSLLLAKPYMCVLPIHHAFILHFLSNCSLLRDNTPHICFARKFRQLNIHNSRALAHHTCGIRRYIPTRPQLAYTSGNKTLTHKPTRIHKQTHAQMGSPSFRPNFQLWWSLDEDDERCRDYRYQRSFIQWS